MCGINGLYDLKRKYSADDAYLMVHTMNEKIVHRGPDHEGMYQFRNLTMGMRRLSILDLKTGNQPITNDAGNLVIVYNGEVYNFQTIRKDLEKRGCSFRTTTDTEVIIKAYEAYGTDCFDMFDGMFALSIYDTETGRLVIARDRIGEKPLYYHKGEDLFLWASELKSISSLNLIPKKINKNALNQYLQLTYIPAPLSIYEGIYKLKPAHYLIVNANGVVEEHEYWALRNIKKNTDITYKEAQERLKKLVEEAVRTRMVSDVPIGAFLSGGIDSGTIVGMMSKLSDSPIDTFTIGFQNKEYDERSRARKVAAFNRSNYHEKVLDYRELLLHVEDILDMMDEPFADPSILPTYQVSRFASEHVKVVLTGDAGDELFLGYSKYLIGYYSRKLKRLPQSLRVVMKKAALRLSDKNAFTRKIRKVVWNADKDDYDQRVQLMSLGFKEDERRRLLKKDHYMEDCMGFLHERYNYDGGDATGLSRAQHLDLTTVLEGDMLAKVDRMSMLNSLETRTPLLSKDLLEFAFSLPDEYKLKRKKLKRIMKDSFKSLLPRDFGRFSKRGFEVPLGDWFRNELRDWMQEILDEKVIKEQGLIEYGEVTRIIDEHMRGEVNRSFEIWTLVVLEKWLVREEL